MPEKDEEKTSETPEKEEKTKKTPPDSEEKEEEKEKENGEEEGEEGKEIKEKEPPKRFPAEKEQTPTDKQIGFLTRKMEGIEKKIEQLGETGFEKGEEKELKEEKTITEEKLNEILEKRDRALTTDRLVDQFIDENPDFRKYAKRIRVYAKDPDYANVPIGFIASGIVGENLDEEANERAKIKSEADKEAEKTKLGGSTKRGISAGKKVWDMTPEEFEAKQAEIFQKGRE